MWDEVQQKGSRGDIFRQVALVKDERASHMETSRAEREMTAASGQSEQSSMCVWKHISKHTPAHLTVGLLSPYESAVTFPSDCTLMLRQLVIHADTLDPLVNKTNVESYESTPALKRCYTGELLAGGSWTQVVLWLVLPAWQLLQSLR